MNKYPGVQVADTRNAVKVVQFDIEIRTHWKLNCSQPFIFMYFCYSNNQRFVVFNHLIELQFAHVK